MTLSFLNQRNQNIEKDRPGASSSAHCEQNSVQLAISIQKGNLSNFASLNGRLAFSVDLPFTNIHCFNFPASFLAGALIVVCECWDKVAAKAAIA